MDLHLGLREKGAKYKLYPLCRVPTISERVGPPGNRIFLLDDDDDDGSNTSSGDDPDVRSIVSIVTPPPPDEATTAVMTDGEAADSAAALPATAPSFTTVANSVGALHLTLVHSGSTGQPGSGGARVRVRTGSTNTDDSPPEAGHENEAFENGELIR